MKFMKVQIHSSWEKVLQSEFGASYFSNLVQFVRKAYSNSVCYPPGPLIFNAFESCPFDNVRVVILGQDPYHGTGQAHGLSFSVPEGVSHPPSLINIFKEIQEDLGLTYPQSGDLTRWAQQGVFLLNTTLTVASGQAGSHQKQGWETFTDAVIKAISKQKRRRRFYAMGRFCQAKNQADRCFQTLGVD